MQADLQGVICFDISGSSNIPSKDIRRFFTRISDFTHRKRHTFFMDDSGIILFPTCEEAYKFVKLLIRRWMDLKKGLLFPLLNGLKMSLSTSFHHHLKPFSADDFLNDEVISSYNLMIAGSPDAVLISQNAYRLLVHFIEIDNVRVMPRTFKLKNANSVEAFEIAFTEFFKQDQYLVRIEPPTDLLLFLALKPELLYKISPRKFEEVMAELLSDFGYDVELRKQTRDKGIDIIAIKRDTEVKLVERYLVQCKRNAPQNKVTFGLVHALLGAGVEEPNTGLILATTSTFTKPALELAKKETVRWRLHLKDYKDIQEWLFKYAQRRQT